MADDLEQDHELNPGRASALRTVMRKAGPSATDMIRADHTRVLGVFHRYKTDARPATKRALFNVIRAMLLVHARVEEEIFYPAMRNAGSLLTEEQLVPEHEEMRTLIAQLSGMDPADPQFDLTFMELMRDVMHHVADEETILLTHAESVLADRLGELGAQMTKRRLELMGRQAAAGRGWMWAAGALAGLLMLISSAKKRSSSLRLGAAG
jgi:hemerythrin superfamily protein